VAVGLGELLVAHRALRAVDPSSRRDAYLALRTALCHRHADLAAFDEAFETCFGSGRFVPPPLDETATLVLPKAPGAASEPPTMPVPGPPQPVPAAWSEVELLRRKDFADYSDEELALARRVIRRLAVRGPERHSRRTRPARRRGVRPDLQRTLRASLRHGGEPLERHWRERGRRPRPVVLVCDVSGSMAPYARMLLQYLQASVAARRRVEAFAFGTRLTRITRELDERDPDRALARASAAVEDWSGGTRIGDSLGTLNRDFGRRLDRGAVCVILSDGWDRGDPGRLAAEMARLRRCTSRIVWLNPLKASPGYEPLVRGMRAALPHVDDFLAGNTLASLEELADLLEERI
jgi:uncharacterized protein with von Willebrand factor type A (vWA) domain